MNCVKSLIALFFFLAFYICKGHEILLPQTLECAYEDTESSVSVPFPLVGGNDREFSLTLSLHATVSNRLDVAFGIDRNGDGYLSLEESEIIIGWSCGKWFFVDRRSDVSDVTHDNPGAKDFVWRLRLDGAHNVKRVEILADGKDVLPTVVAKCCSSYFNSRWNILRVSTCGIVDPEESVKIKLLADGLLVRIR